MPPPSPPRSPADLASTDAPNPEHPEARFVKLADINGTFVKDAPREDYTELLDSIKTHGQEKPIILRQDEQGGFQLVDGFHPFEGHPFNVVDNKDMWDLQDSVQRYGVMEPVMVINRPAGGYEMVSGHRRLRACQLAGVQTIPAIVRNLDRNEAAIAMVDANLKREKISPMEMARALAMKSEALRRKVGRRSKAEAAAGRSR